tara:strand:+ start:1921 stop:4533 length:2613 start_codon:yes stop_codon:yes gene_type:complete
MQQLNARLPTPPSLTQSVNAIFRHELRSLLYAPLSYLFQVGFLVSLTAAIFLVADFYATDEASLRLLNVFLPWIALILVPALAMRSWPDSHDDRSIELIMTLPISPLAMVIGKFLAGLSILIITLSFTFPLAITVNYLGDPDIGALLGTYFAATLLLALYYSISLLAASIIREPIGAFISGLSGLLILLLLGWDVLGRLLKENVSAQIVDYLSLYSPYTWMTVMGRGFIETAGLFYFLGAISVALLFTSLIIEGKRYGSRSTMPSRLPYLKGWLTLIVFLIAAPLIARSGTGLDLTEGKEFTLHTGTESIISRLPENTLVTLYWSADETSVPANIKSHARRIQSMLRKLAASSDGRLKYLEINPKPDTDEELEALRYGLRRIPMSSGDSFFLGLTATQGGRTGNVPYLDIRRDRLTEYDIALTLNGLTRSKTPKIGLLSPLIPSRAASNNRQGMAFISELKRAYDLAIIPYFKPQLPSGLNTLIILDAAILRRQMLYAIDQFVMEGGSLIVMVDPYVRSNRASNKLKPGPSDEVNDITDLLERYGLLYNDRQVVGDSSAGAVVADREQRSFTYPFWMRIRENGFSYDHPVTASLNELFFVESGYFENMAPDRVVPLVMTSIGAGVLDRTLFSKHLPRDLAAKFSTGNEKKLVAGAIRGPFQSAFAERPHETPNDATEQKKHRSLSIGAPSVFAVADVDWVFDAYSLQTTEIQGRTMVRPLNDNLTFLLNLLEFASGDRSLINIRSRGRLNRPFLKVESLFRAAQEAYQAEEKQLSERISTVEKLIAKAPDAAGVSKLSQLPTKLQKRVKELKTLALDLRRELRALRRTIREDVESLGQRLTLINMISGPFLVFFFWLFVSAYRGRSNPSG